MRRGHGRLPACTLALRAGRRRHCMRSFRAERRARGRGRKREGGRARELVAGCAPGSLIESRSNRLPSSGRSFERGVHWISSWWHVLSHPSLPIPRYMSSCLSVDTQTRQLELPTLFHFPRRTRCAKIAWRRPKLMVHTARQAAALLRNAPRRHGSSDGDDSP